MGLATYIVTKGAPAFEDARQTQKVGHVTEATTFIPEDAAHNSFKVPYLWYEEQETKELALGKGRWVKTSDCAMDLGVVPTPPPPQIQPSVYDLVGEYVVTIKKRV